MNLPIKPNPEVVNQARAKLIEEEKRKLQLQQKALDANSQMTLSEIKTLQRENTKRIVDRVLFVLGLLAATVLICIIVWPLFSFSMSFFTFNNPQKAYDQGLISATKYFDWAHGYEISNTGTNIYILEDPDPDTREYIKDDEGNAKNYNTLIKILLYNGSPVEDAGIIGDNTDISKDDIIYITLNTDEDAKVYQIDSKSHYLLDAERIININTRPKEGGGCSSSLWEHIDQLKKEKGIYDENSRIKDSDAMPYTTIKYHFIASRGVFFIGYRLPSEDPSCAILYTLSGILIFIILIALIALYVVLMSYGIRYFVGLIKGLTTGAKNLVVETGRNVAGAVLEETADKTLEDVQKEAARKRKEAAKKRKATMARKKAEAEALADDTAVKDTVSAPVTIDTDNTDMVEDEKPANAAVADKPKKTKAKKEKPAPDPEAALEEMSDEQLDALLNSAPEDSGRESLFSD